MSQIINITKENIDGEHICCAMGKDQAKKAWLKERFAEGLVFKRLDDRGKVFIEYMPVEAAWKPVEGANWLIINCLWVSGKFKGQGWSSRLLEECLKDARDQGKAGVLYVSTGKKEHYLTDKSFFIHKGFEVIDEAPPSFELLAYRIQDETSQPRFSSAAKQNIPGETEGFRFVYSDQCPFTGEYVPLMAGWAREAGYKTEVIRLTSAEQSRELAGPFGTLGIWFQGRPVGHSPMTEKTFAKLLAGLEA